MFCFNILFIFNEGVMLSFNYIECSFSERSFKYKYILKSRAHLSSQGHY